MNLRMDDVKDLFEYIKSNEVKYIPSISLENLSFCGHSYGGSTSIEACSKFSDNFNFWKAVDPVFRSRLAENSIQKELYVS